MKTALVCGAGGFIGSHLVKRLKREGFWVRELTLNIQSLVRQKLTISLSPICVTLQIAER